MSIPESQLEIWSHQGATTIASNTYQAIRGALEADSSPLQERDFEIYLQGSYRNDTNTRGDSDVDVVVQLNSTFISDTSSLSLQEQSHYKRTFDNADYGWRAFRADVLTALRNYFGRDNMSEGNNSLKLKMGSGRLSADIIPCLQYRKYRRFTSATKDDYVEGILFIKPMGECVVNYPRAIAPRWGRWVDCGGL